MSVTVSVFQTLSCDGPKCDKSELLETLPNGQPVPETQKKIDTTPWIKHHRQVVASGKQFVFCSDTCLVNAATAGMFIPEEEKQIINPEGNANALIRAALEAKAREKAADAALRSGASVTISSK